MLTFYPSRMRFDVRVDDSENDVMILKEFLVADCVELSYHELKNSTLSRINFLSPPASRIGDSCSSWMKISGIFALVRLRLFLDRLSAMSLFSPDMCFTLMSRLLMSIMLIASQKSILTRLLALWELNRLTTFFESMRIAMCFAFLSLPIEMAVMTAASSAQ